MKTEANNDIAQLTEEQTDTVGGGLGFGYAYNICYAPPRPTAPQNRPEARPTQYPASYPWGYGGASFPIYRVR
jgi:hypothetical protein